MPQVYQTYVTQIDNNEPISFKEELDEDTRELLKQWQGYRER